MGSSPLLIALCAMVASELSEARETVISGVHQADAIVDREVVLDRRVVGHVAEDLVFGSDPEAMATADHPLRLARLAHLLGVILKHVLALWRLVRKDSRADIEADDEFRMAVRELEIILPAAVFEVLDVHCGEGRRVW